ncbi:hypothetical protein MKX01_032695 [Papaver californicum]|nr:hypothetical protein MKX01_032695 [Papaver californicum]
MGNNENEFGKTICTICYEDLKPLVEDLQAISICGHVFHELCLQQWLEYCNGKKQTCPVCKQKCCQEKISRLYFQSIASPIDEKKSSKICFEEEDPRVLRVEVKKIEIKISELTGAFERQEKELKDTTEQLCVSKAETKREMSLKNDALKEREVYRNMIRTSSEERSKAESECARLQQRSLGLAKELAALKLVSDYNLEEEEVLKLASFSTGDSNKDTIDVLKPYILGAFAEEDIGRHSMSVPSGMGSATASRGLEVAVANLQDYCNELENRLLSRFDAASQRRELSTMSGCAKILSQFNRGSSAMQHYVRTRPMFMDAEVMNADTMLVLGDQGSQVSPSDVSRGLASLYKEITDTVWKEAATTMAVFPSPNDVMAILVQRVLEERVRALLDKLLVKPSLVNLPPVDQGGLLLYLRILAVAFEKTQELARDLRAVGCGDLDVEGLTESLFVAHKDEYPEHEQASLRQLFKAKMEKLSAESQPESSRTIGRSRGASVASSQQQISVTVVTEFVRWNEEAISRCTLFSSLYFTNSLSRLLLPVDAAHAASCEEMATAMSSAEGAAHKGLQQCIETVMAEVFVAYLSRVLEVSFTGTRLHKGLLSHWQKYTFNPSGRLRLKHDITEFGEYVCSFNAPSVDEKFELLGIMANIFIVAPESLATLFEGTPSIRKDAQRFIQLREDYKSAKLASRLSSLWQSSS